MTFTAPDSYQAAKIAAEMRAAFRGTPWVVTVAKPLFAGDLYRITVG